MQTRRYTHVHTGEAAQHSGRTQNKRMSLPTQITSNKPGTSVSPAQLSPRVAGSHRKTKLYSQAMKKILPPLNDLISKRNPAVAVSNYTKTFIVPMKEDKEF